MLIQTGLRPKTWRLSYDRNPSTAVHSPTHPACQPPGTGKAGHSLRGGLACTSPLSCLDFALRCSGHDVAPPPLRYRPCGCSALRHASRLITRPPTGILPHPLAAVTLLETCFKEMSPSACIPHLNVATSRPFWLEDYRSPSSTTRQQRPVWPPSRLVDLIPSLNTRSSSCSVRSRVCILQHVALPSTGPSVLFHPSSYKTLTL